MRALIAIVLVAAAGCGTAETSSKPPEAPVCVADPAMARPENDCGVFVSSSLGLDTEAGTRELPVRSIERAIALAEAGPMRVYACAEVFLDPVVVPAGIEIWGGLDCIDGWAYVGGERRTRIAPKADTVPLRFMAGEGRAIVADVLAKAASATEPGGASIAVMVMPDAAVEILRSELVAGNGMPGTRGEDGAPAPAADGVPGNHGGDECGGDVVPGGAAVVTMCDGIASIGGKGGDGHLTYGDGGEDGLPEPVPNPQLYGLGGFGEGNGLPCWSGADGAPGADGELGRGASGIGRIGLTGWQGEKGQDGGTGLMAQGGGGGGGRRGPSGGQCGANKLPGGAGGGGGGSGGCGGKGGKGGGPGGASIGLLSLSGNVTVRSSTILAGNGGDGGRGGNWQGGGYGGHGGNGGKGIWTPWGCSAGRGGKGGNGGHAGGGLGGPSVGIAHVIDLAPVQENVTIDVALPGEGGLGGTVTVPLPGMKGADGIAGNVVTFPSL